MHRYRYRSVGTGFNKPYVSPVAYLGKLNLLQGK